MQPDSQAGALLQSISTPRKEPRSLFPKVGIPAELGQESQASSCLRKGTPLASRIAQGVKAFAIDYNYHDLKAINYQVFTWYPLLTETMSFSQNQANLLKE